MRGWCRSIASVVTLFLAVTQVSFAAGVPPRAPVVAPHWRPFYLDGNFLGTATGHDGNIWVADYSGAALLRLDRGGITRVISTFPYGPQWLAVAPNGVVYSTWLRILGGRFVYGLMQVTPNGTVSNIPLTDDAWGGVTVTPDGAVWFVERRHIGHISREGTLREFAIQPLFPNEHHPRGDHATLNFASGIALGDDGQPWVSASAPRDPFLVGKFDLRSRVTRLYGYGQNSVASSVVVGADGNAWWALSAGLLRVDDAGDSRYFRFAPQPGHRGRLLFAGFPQSLVAGADGAIWAAMQYAPDDIVMGGAIGRFDIVHAELSVTLTPPESSWLDGLAFDEKGDAWATGPGEIAALLHTGPP